MTGYENVNAYKKAFATVDGVNQVVMLFDTAIANLQQAKQAIADKKIEERFNKISRVYQILTGLRDSLDMDRGGEVSGVLKDWYTGTAHRVLSINKSENLEMLDVCIKNIKEMRDAWVEVEKTVKSGSEDKNPAEGTSFTPANNSDSFDIKAARAAMNISV